MRNLLVNQRIGTVVGASVVVTRVPRRDIDAGGPRKLPARSLRGEQRPDFLFKRLVAGACATPERRRVRPAVGPEPTARMAIDLFPAFSVHRLFRRPVRDTATPSPFRQSRFTVIAGDMPRTSAVSSTLSPPKKRISTTCALRGSRLRQRGHRVVECGQFRRALATNHGDFIQNTEPDQ